MTPELEKTNLEAHVELEKVREIVTNNQLENIESRIEGIISDIEDIKESIKKLNETRNSQIINTGAVIITLLLTILGALLIKVLIPLFLAK